MKNYVPDNKYKYIVLDHSNSLLLQPTLRRLRTIQPVSVAVLAVQGLRLCMIKPLDSPLSLSRYYYISGWFLQS